ncbi:MAG TPA: tRNA pseudouridine(38-40) synthase TruA [Anaeromyxobacter sp.]|nr:tRNA pseudouridine(38-40) synthase TruA [Anaeromyxobacter sp.]
MERRFYAMRLWYDGRRYHGWQRQPGTPTVQEAVEEALARAGVRAPLAAAARTDRGVHATSQVVSFAVRAALEPSALRRAVNAALPADVAVLDVWCPAGSFHARASARARTYVYLVGTALPPELHGYAWSLPDDRAFPSVPDRPLDPAAMRRALAAAVGTHDFAPFARPGAAREATRTLLRAEVHSASWTPLHALVLEGTGFVRAMVRNLVGTAVAAGLGVASPAIVGELLRAGGRYRGVRAPAWGLTLASVAYREE